MCVWIFPVTLIRAMAPIGMAMGSTLWPLVSQWTVLTIVVSLIALVSLVLLIVSCACCGASKPQGRADKEAYYSIDPKHPDFCGECARATMQEYNEMNWGPGQSPGGSYEDYNDRRSGLSPVGPSRYTVLPVLKRRPADQSGSTTSSDASPAFHRDHRKVEPSRPGLQETRQIATAENKTNNQMFFLAKSGVFDKGTPRGTPKATHRPNCPAVGDTKMISVQKDPRYKTMFVAESNVFDKPRPAGPAAQKTVAGGGNESRMRVAWKDPAYRTMWDAKSDIFEKGGKKPSSIGGRRTASTVSLAGSRKGTGLPSVSAGGR